MTSNQKTWVQYDRSLPYIEDRDPKEEPKAHLIKEGENSYIVKRGRRPSKLLFINKLRRDVKKWRDNDYQGLTSTTRNLLTFWFDSDLLMNKKLFNFWFCQREAIETLIFLFEIKKYADLEPFVKEYAKKYRKDVLGPTAVSYTHLTLPTTPYV